MMFLDINRICIQTQERLRMEFWHALLYCRFNEFVPTALTPMMVVEAQSDASGYFVLKMSDDTTPDRAGIHYTKDAVHGGTDATFVNIGDQQQIDKRPRLSTIY